MWTYLSVYIYSLVSLHIAWKAKAGVVRRFFHLSATIPLILLGGFRDRSIGSDTDLYIWDRFSDAVAYKDNLLFFMITSHQEIGYMMINWLTAQFTKSHAVFLSIMQALIVIPMYVSAWKLRKWVSPVLVMFIFVFIQYQYSFSLIRQCTALSFCVLAFVLYLEGKYGKALTTELVAITFHYSAVLALMFPIIFRTVSQRPIKRYPLAYMIIGIVVIVVFINAKYFLIQFLSLGLFDGKYDVYAADSDMFGQSLQASNLVIKILTVVIAYAVLLKNKSNRFVDFFFVMALLDFGFSMLGLINRELYRLSMYPRMLSFVSLPFFFKYYDRFLGKIKIRPFVCAIVVFFWWYIYIHGGYGSVDTYEMSPVVFKE